MKHVFVFDPSSFLGMEWKTDEILDSLGQYFRAQGDIEFTVDHSRYRRNAIGIIQREVEKSEFNEIIRVYAVGGDEILYDCVNAVTHFPNIQLAYIPYSGKNDFLKTFGEDNVDKFKDLTSVINGEAIPTDVIRWGVNYTLNFCYIGMNTALIKKNRDLKSDFGKKSFHFFSKISQSINYFFSAFNKEFSNKEYKIKIDNVDYSGNYCLIHIANSPFYNGKLSGAVEATPDDGLLNVCLIKSSHPLKMLSSLNEYFYGKRPKDCLVFQAKRITIESEKPMWIQLDSEYIQDTNINLNVVHQALSFITINNLSYPIATILAH